MKAVVAPVGGGPDVLEVRELPDPEPGPSEVAVDVEASGVNFLDTTQRAGAPASEPPFIVGLEGAGIVRQVGEGVDHVAVGDRVAWPFTPSSNAEVVVLSADAAIPVPDGVSSELAAAVIAQGLTAHYLAVDCAPVQEGHDVLVHAAAGGVGSLLVQIARLRGARVFGTTSSKIKSSFVERLGGEPLLYEDTAEQILARTGGRGVDIVFDSVGRATFEQSLMAVARRGHFVSYGKQSGALEPIDPQRLFEAGSVSFTKPALKDFIASRDELLGRASDLFAWVAAGDLHVEIGGRYRFADASTAHRELEARRSTGKLLLLPDRTLSS